jgi:hypothetical protein
VHDGQDAAGPDRLEIRDLVRVVNVDHRVQADPGRRRTGPGCGVNSGRGRMSPTLPGAAGPDHPSMAESPAITDLREINRPLVVACPRQTALSTDRGKDGRQAPERSRQDPAAGRNVQSARAPANRRASRPWFERPGAPRGGCRSGGSVTGLSTFGRVAGGSGRPTVLRHVPPHRGPNAQARWAPNLPSPP